MIKITRWIATALFVFLLAVIPPANTPILYTAEAANRYYMRDFYPLPFDKVFYYTHYLQAGTMEATLYERWGVDNDNNPYNGNFTFTIHRVYYPQNGDWRNYWCPRVDDVMTWESNKLYYSDTYFFYSPSHHTLLLPAQTWADEYMTVGDVPSTVLNHTAKNLTHSNCGSPIDGTLIHSHPYTHAFRALAVETTDWSPYTGGPTVNIPVVRLDQATYLRDTPTSPYNDFFKEEWYFAWLSSLGRYIPIHALGYHQLPSGSRVDQWNMRLTAITNR